MQVRNQHLPIASKYDYLFSSQQKTNRLELISDFPNGNNAEVISSLQIHPQNWVALSRNNSYDDSSEWLCVHDIQKMENDAENVEAISTNMSQQIDEIEIINDTNEQRIERNSVYSTNMNIELPTEPPEQENIDEVQVIPFPLAPTLRPPFGDTEILDLWTGSLTYNHRSRRQLLERPSRINSGILTMNYSKNNRKPIIIQQNRERLVFYQEELNVGKGFIKELCFSSDGR
jgi:DDB1- and CUL4-associated factor 10